MKRCAGNHWPFLFFLIVSSFCLLQGLDHTMFWQDEGHGAVLAQRILQYGYPRVWDGRNLLTGMDGLDFNADYALTWDGWLPYYLTAASFALFGASTFTARLPFVLISLASCLLLYSLIFHWLKDRWCAFWSVFYMVSPLMFLLHSRQCRYYSLLPFGLLVVLWGITLFPARRCMAITTATAGLLILFYSHVVTFGLVVLSLVVLFWFCERSVARFKFFFCVCGITGLLVLPTVWYTGILQKAGTHAPTKWNRVLGQQVANVLLINKFFVPILLLLLGYYLYRRVPWRAESRFFRRGLLFLLVPTMITPFVLPSVVRYLYYLFPVTGFLSALVLLQVFRSSRKWGVCLFCLLVFTHAPDYLPVKLWIEGGNLIRRLAPSPVAGAVRYLYEEYTSVDDEEGPSHLPGAHHILYRPQFWDRFWRGEYWGYWHEITQPFPDTLSAVMAFLKSHRGINEGVYMNVDQAPLLFYYPEVKIVYAMTHPPAFENTSDPLGVAEWNWQDIVWFVPRDFCQTRGPCLAEEEFLSLMQQAGKHVIAHELPASHYSWNGNHPERFRLYRIRQGEFPIVQDRRQLVYEVRE